MDFESAANKYIDMVYRVAVNGLKNPADAEDITQTVFMKLYKKIDGLESDAHIKNWLIRVTVNECKRHMASPWRRKTVPLEDYENTLCFENGDEGWLYSSVMALPAKYRVAIYLFYYEDYSVKEAAKALKISESAFTTRLSRGREKLRDMIGGSENG